MSWDTSFRYSDFALRWHSNSETKRYGLHSPQCPGSSPWRSGYSCLIAAADTFRAAAVQQVSVWGERSGVPVVSNPSANAEDKLAPEAVVESLLVLDASQGQNGLRQAMAFASAAGLTGVVLTKLDGSARGGVALAVASEARLPIRFIGAGETIRDLRPFNSFEFVEALLAG